MDDRDSQSGATVTTILVLVGVIEGCRKTAQRGGRALSMGNAVACWPDWSLVTLAVETGCTCTRNATGGRADLWRQVDNCQLNDKPQRRLVER
jgi:hypothetical protein